MESAGNFSAAQYSIRLEEQARGADMAAAYKSSFLYYLTHVLMLEAAIFKNRLFSMLLLRLQHAGKHKAQCFFKNLTYFSKQLTFFKELFPGCIFFPFADEKNFASKKRKKCFLDN